MTLSAMLVTALASIAILALIDRVVLWADRKADAWYARQELAALRRRQRGMEALGRVCAPRPRPCRAVSEHPRPHAYERRGAA